jgi:NAD(P)-dependent dehydrogenase (short-subunit alcohol dehydrogenase family)
METNKVFSDLDYRGKTVIITGSAQGAGSGIAKRFAEAGAHVAVTYRTNREAAEKEIKELKNLGVDADCFFLDQKKTQDIDGVIQAVVKRFGSLDCLVNNAGIYPHKPSLEMTEADWDDMLETNTRGVFFVSQSAAKIMKEQKSGGAIVNVSSINATNPCVTLIHYGVSKAAVEMLTRCLAADWGRYGIRVNCIAPGLVDAPRLDEFVPGWRESYSSRAPLGRIVRPEDLGNACVFLGSGLASFITGQILTVDGGVLLAQAYETPTKK